jgi:tRNA A-37 threonylcarbamoyl transferase component Bud32
MTWNASRRDAPAESTTEHEEQELATRSHESGVHRSVERDSRFELPPGTLVAGKYRVREVLGRGGFAVVYAAEHVSLGREVALKVLHRDDTTHAVLLERFSREMRISALVRHPHVLEVYDAGTLEDGSPFLAMEKIVGLTLQQSLDEQQRLSVDDALELGTQLAWALVALAERGIVHRDIKPENLMLAREPDGALHLKLVDFGISLIRHERVEGRLTQRGTLLGTPHYMAPEQLRSQVLDARIDLYASGVVLYQALTGRVPYDGEDLSSLTLNVLNGQARGVRELRPDCPPALARVVERALARDPEDRYPDAATMLEDLLVCRGERAASGTSGQRLHALARWSHAHAKPLLALIALTSALGLGWGALRSPLETAARDREPDAALSDAHEPMLAQALPSAGPAAGAHATSALDAVTTAPAARDTRAANTLARKALGLLLQGDVHAAYLGYRRAVEADATHPAALRGLGLSAARLSLSAEARAAFTRYLEVAPQAADARAVRARLAQLPAEQR